MLSALPSRPPNRLPTLANTAGDRIQADVLGQDLGRVLGADEACFEHREAGGHPHDEGAHHEEIEGIERVAEFSDPAAQCS